MESTFYGQPIRNPEKVLKINTDFSQLDTRHLKKRFNLKKLDVIGNILYVTSQQDDWYIEWDATKKTLVLFHRNSKHNTSAFHKETFVFDTVFHVLAYIKHHDKKVFALGKKGKLQKSRMEILFEEIEKSRRRNIKSPNFY